MTSTTDQTGPAQFQVIQLTGRLVRDPDLRNLENGSSVCVLRLAVDGMGRGGPDQAGFVNVASFGKPGQAAADTLTKGWLVAVTGRLQHETWQTPEESSRESYGIIGHVEFLAAPKHGENDADPSEADHQAREEDPPF
jgi:single-strand DNA-binding protein